MTVLTDEERMMGSSRGAQLDGLTPPSESGWIAWSGGDQPVADGVMVQCRMPRGMSAIGRAEDWIWDDSDPPIIAYRVVSDGGEAVHEQVSQPIRDASKSAPTKAPSREEVALMIASWPAHYRDLGPDNEVIGDRVSMDPSQDIGEIPGSIERLADAIITLFKGGEQ